MFHIRLILFFPIFNTFPDRCCTLDNNDTLAAKIHHLNRRSYQDSSTNPSTQLLSSTIDGITIKETSSDSPADINLSEARVSVNTDIPNIAAMIPTTVVPSTYHLYEHVTKERLAQRCPSSKSCLSSELYWLVCGNDGNNYKNLGVLACAQRCNIDLKLKKFGPCEKSKLLMVPELKTSRGGVTSKAAFFSFPLNITDHVDEETVNYVKSRIIEVSSQYKKSLRTQTFCRDHPTSCPYGFDPFIDPAVYFNRTWRSSQITEI